MTWKHKSCASKGEIVSADLKSDTANELRSANETAFGRFENIQRRVEKSNMKITIGSRESNLALRQTRQVRDLILKQYPDWEIDIKKIKTKGDKILDKSISQIGGKEVFVKEIEEEMLNGTVDMAVHSMKDMPGYLPEGLMLTCVPEREDPRDVLILRENIRFEDIPEGARIGTSSKRRAYQIKAWRPDLQIVPIRGNVETRIRKIEEENLAGVILAAAGIHRLGLEPENMVYLEQDIMLPSPTQGILAIEIAESNTALHQALMFLNHEQSERQARVERDFLRAVGGSCAVPVGAYARIEGDAIRLDGLLGDSEGNVVRDFVCGTAEENLGQILGEKLNNALKQFQGKVYLAGAGPGDAELVTLKTKRAIEEADVIVYDRLANPNLLNFNMEAKRIYVGKKAGCHYKTQDEINEILFEEARQGQIVTRLKGGDPYVFGRGGEEALYLKERGIKFEIIPGVTSSIAGPAYAGIPVTHRETARSFHVITGQQNDNQDLNYEQLAQLEGSLVFLMGFENMEKICNGLLEQGKDPATPAAVIQWAGTSKQKVLTGVLSDIYEKTQSSDIGRPAIILLGDVVRLRKDLNFYEELPLFGHNIVITREAKRAQSTIQKFQSLGANVLSFPMIKTTFLDSEELKAAIENIESYNYIFFTSVNGVDFFMEKFLQESDVRKLHRAKFCTIGTKTYEALKNYGIKAELMPEHFEGMEAVEVLKKHVAQSDKVLVPRAKLGRNEIVDELKKFCQVEELKIYDTLINDIDKDEIIDRLNEYEGYETIFTSASTFKNFAKILGEDLAGVLEKGHIVSIGPITTKAIVDAGYTVDIEAEEYTIEGIIKAIRGAK